MPHRYEKAPIAEAIIDLKVQRSAGLEVLPLEALAASFKDQFPTNAPLRRVEWEWRNSPNVDTQIQTDAQTVGYRLDNADRNRVLQIQTSGFTYSHLSPYTDWPTFRDEAVPLWERFSGDSGVSHVTRLAVRVINRLTIVGHVSDVSKYCNLGVRMPISGLPQPRQYFVQTQIDENSASDGYKIIINSGAVATASNLFELLLDFDLYREGKWDARSGEIWSLLDELSRLKNDIFEACITDATRRLIQ